MPSSAKSTAILLLSCPERKGVVASVTEFIYKHNGNIFRADEHQDREHNMFLMRLEWELEDFDLPMHDFAREFQPLAQEFQMQWRTARSTDRPRVAIMVSHSDHCLADLLYRHSIGELRCDFPLVMSNHSDALRIAEFYRVPFFQVPVDKQNKLEAERRELELL